MSSEVEAHRQPFNPLVKKGHVADLSAALSTDHGSNLCQVDWGPPIGASCIRNLLCPAGLVVLARLGDKHTTPILPLIYAFVESLMSLNIAFVKSPVETSHLKLLSLPHKVTSVRTIPSIASPKGAGVIPQWQSARVIDSHLTSSILRRRGTRSRPLVFFSLRQHQPRQHIRGCQKCGASIHGLHT